MAEEQNGQPPNGAGQQDGSGDQPRPADAPPASWDDIFQHERFKTLLKRAKDAETALEKTHKERNESEESKLKEQKRFEELFQKEQQRAAALEMDLQSARQAALNDKKQRALEAAARAHEPPFSAQALNDVALFVDFEALQVGENGAVTGAEAVIRDLAKSRPYMLEQRRQDPGSPGAQKPAAGPPDAARQSFERTVRTQIVR